MRIIETSRELSKKELYNSTKSATVFKMSDLANETEMNIDYWVHYVDEKEDGTEVDVIAIKEITGDTYATNSKSFIKAFLDIVDVMQGDEFNIVKLNGVSRAGRTYITCSLA